MRSIVLFKRDLRAEDNKVLYEAFKNSRELIPIFIFNKSILKKFNSYNQKLGLIIDGVKKLSEKINLYVFYGEDDEVLEFLFLKYKPDALYTAESFSWQGEKRDKGIEKLCLKYRIGFNKIFDNFLVNFRLIPYNKVFTPFYKKWLNFIDNQEVNINLNELNKKILNLNLDKIDDLLIKNKEIDYQNNIWNYEFGIKRLKEFNFKDYDKNRSFPSLDGTSKLSPYIRFGLISVRKIYNLTSKLNQSYVQELSWREFWYHIKYNFNDFKNLEFQEKRRNINWNNDSKLLDKFLNAQTGYPIVDAGIRQLKTENWMHNRVRMIVANFLTKDLLIDWRIGEKFFKDYLIDYDEIVNVGNWQWCASVGPDPRPLRIFNPIIQSEKFDPEANYIKTYIPELKNINPKLIHNPLKNKLSYYKPIVNHYEQIQKIKNQWIN
ncbi:MAG: deoxyribodipyrimidine photo-lyase [Candidatus Parcubacteria bacterium]|nr:MAG: deoxyribodipyrimidine photo-lyase [Candidatus Parcubacteria bacterium]